MGDSAFVEGPFANTPTVKHVYTNKFSLDAPVLVMKGPIGSRYIYPIIEGTYEGGSDYPNCEGTVHGPSADWALGHVDGSGVTLDVRLICRTPSGATSYATAVGKSARDAKDPTMSVVSTAAVFEAADEDTKWMNNKILVGCGKKWGSSIEVVYYELLHGSGSAVDTYNLKMDYAFSMKFSVGGSASVPNGPTGSKTISHEISGGFKGGKGSPKFYGTIQGPGTYSERTLPEGHEGVCLDVKLIFNLPSGASISVTLTGRRTKIEGFPTRKSTVNTSAVFEVGDDAKDFKYLNNKIYHGIGTKEGNTLSLDYYEVNAKS
mmetsp:Transcript_7124/g.10211  ORF Transcript_7124/g.10211 Transcript_7124/m.10211 type:complete len:319 (-) Transcript_7124:95-1051(-)|eukprot:CAMPEP_0184869964 /NCGR_PEP_ID=MMETSP0580-20130426/35969_1 /TAXON_ID=1118495 /ORGANISM="Dactyliosolen fragilissimus" /LENGTH=318 /DNA_ID=CAMNT_0027371809 /DNA_START=180 /DNA_END=1136 /DNA_ORIENTATION=-